MNAFVTWLQATPLSQAIVFNTWIWPACETIHFMGLALVLGIVGFFDLRLIGFFKRVPVAAVRGLMPFAILGFFLNVVTGLVFLIGHPEQYATNIAWWFKLGCLALAGLNAAAFEQWLAPQTLATAAGEDTPPAAQTIGIISIIAWFGVLYFGRMLPFIGNAY